MVFSIIWAYDSKGVGPVIVDALVAVMVHHSAAGMKTLFTEELIPHGMGGNDLEGNPQVKWRQLV